MRFTVALSYIGEVALCGDNGVTVFPDGQERAIRRYAIIKRNEWMIKRGDAAICYVRHNMSNRGKLLSKVKAKGMKVVNIGQL